MNKITLIGDVHGKYYNYINICANNEYTIQLGDLGYDNTEVLQGIDPAHHQFIYGNHDNHSVDYDLPHCLGRFGARSLNNIDFFFVSGAFSIDKKYRIDKVPQTWFPNEELSYAEGMACLELYEKIKPDLVLTHDFPRSIINKISNPEKLKDWGFDPDTFTTSTSELLEAMFKIHQPRYWWGGHHHCSKTFRHNGTRFQVLNELETLIIEI